MKESAADRRLAENEVIFRRANKKALDALETAREEEEAEHVKPADEQNMTLHFYCECADDQCRARLPLTMSEYESNHRQSNQFIVLPGHEIPHIEKVTKKAPGYFVVQKYMTPPRDAKKLHPKKKNI